MLCSDKHINLKSSFYVYIHWYLLTSCRFICLFSDNLTENCPELIQHYTGQLKE